MPDPILEAAATELRRRIDDHVAQLKSHPSLEEIAKLQKSLNSLEELLGSPLSRLADLLGFDSEAGDDVAVPVRFDEFFGLPALEAAKRYLRKCKDARPFEEIVRAVKTGGGKVDSEDDLRVGLTRSTFDVVKIGARFGAIENYPHIKRGSKKRRPVPVGNEEPEPEEADEQSSDNSSDSN